MNLPRPPGPLVAYLPNAAPEPLAECLVAFANTEGGAVLIGLDEKGRLLNGVYPEELENALRAAERLCRPPVVTGWEQVETGSGTAFAINVPRSPELHSLADGRVLIRVGAENRPLGGEEIRQLAATKSAGDFEAELEIESVMMMKGEGREINSPEGLASEGIEGVKVVGGGLVDDQTLLSIKSHPRARNWVYV